MGPSVVSAWKSGAVSPIRRLIYSSFERDPPLEGWSAMFEAACGYFLARGCGVIKVAAPTVTGEETAFRLPRRRAPGARGALRVGPGPPASPPVREPTATPDRWRGQLLGRRQEVERVARHIVLADL